MLSALAQGGFVRFLKRFLENIEAWIYEAGIVVTNRRCKTFHFVTNQLCGWQTGTHFWSKGRGAQGVDLLFHSVKDTQRPERTMEIDFLFCNGIKICPIEVKSSRFREHVSLDRFIAAYSKRLGARYVVTASSYFTRTASSICQSTWFTLSSSISSPLSIFSRTRARICGIMCGAGAHGRLGGRIVSCQ